MAILWQKKIKNTQYEVRSAGQTRRLYTDGVFHSQFNPNRAITGGVWDLLMLPTFFVVGTQKAGTTALHHYLLGHPDIYLPEQKETK